MNYRNRILNHLKKYKKDNFLDIPHGTYRGKIHEHIFPKKFQKNNLIETYRDEIQKSSLYDVSKLHIYFNHLNSSQAMCFNFFYPLYHERKLELVTDFLGIKNEEVNYETVCFEKEGSDGIKNKRRATSFDFYFETKTGKEIFFEIKYTESEFGKAKNDDEHKEKFKEIYSNHLLPLNENFRSREKFLENYQICRNLIHIKENSFVVFVYPASNRKINEGARKAKTEILTTEFTNNFFSATWEKLFENIMPSITEEKLKKQLTEFKKKYIVVEENASS